MSKNKNLDALFNMGDISNVKDTIDKINKINDDIEDNSEDDTNLPALNTINELDKVLSVDVDGSDEEFDEIAKEAFDSYKNLMETADNFSDTRYSGKFYEAAVAMLGKALDAKNSKVNAKLRKMELLLKAEKVFQTKKEVTESNNEFQGKIIVTSRADILNAFKDEK